MQPWAIESCRCSSTERAADAGSPPVPTGPAGMPGMATDAQLAQLRAAKGKAFDDLFLKLMITHHEGAVAMAVDALTDGNNIRVEEMANEVISQQTTEIDRMRKMAT